MDNQPKEDDRVTDFKEELIDKNIDIVKELSIFKKCEIADDDDDVICTSYLKLKEERIFNPISKAWQVMKCKQLQLQFRTMLMFKGINKVLKEPTATKNIVGDGNCLFRALCYCLTGNEDDHLILRKLISEVIIPLLNKLKVILFAFILR